MKKEKSNTKSCSVCGSEIAKNAKICPSCGAKNKKPIYQRWWFIALLVIIAGMVVSGIVSSNEKKNATYIKVTSVKIMKAYSDNEAKANENYTDKYVEVTGKISNMDESTIWLKGDDDWGISELSCQFVDEQETAKISKLKKGSKITIKGKCTGLSISDVIIEDCSIVK